MADVKVAPKTAAAPGVVGMNAGAAAPTTAAPEAGANPESKSPFVFTRADDAGGADLLEAYALRDMLEQFRTRLANNRLRTTFLHYLGDLPVELDGEHTGVPIRPRCRAGSLMAIARAPENEDVQELQPFEDRILRSALTLREGGAKPKMPEWLDEEQPLGIDDRKRKKEREKRRRKRKKRSSKRKRGAEDGEDGERGDDGGNEEERRKRKKKKRRAGDAPTPGGP